MHDDSDYRRVELITGRRRRRNWSDEEKFEIMAASNELGFNILEPRSSPGCAWMPVFMLHRINAIEHTLARPAQKGRPLPKLKSLINDPKTEWQRIVASSWVTVGRPAKPLISRQELALVSKWNTTAAHSLAYRQRSVRPS